MNNLFFMNMEGKTVIDSLRLSVVITSQVLLREYQFPIIYCCCSLKILLKETMSAFNKLVPFVV